MTSETATDKQGVRDFGVEDIVAGEKKTQGVVVDKEGALWDKIRLFLDVESFTLPRARE